ncbi:aminotransferase-like domain-containing protein [Pseudoalteromonas sp. BMB]|uniref:aminotransferase-like domain-containing protein n=1 Tax=Pseudoalteromonas sp. BMB TaxID=1874619 RepID=UPI0015861458|nr:PLP-dependent aminotransferase family protein [Pseudoalteromonas sp. BMB]
MNFLNEVSSQYPKATSLASGRPLDWNFSLDLMREYQDVYCNFAAKRLRVDRSEIEKQLCQYGSTTGVINELLCQSLIKDEDIVCKPEDILVTNGCQEALTLLALEFCKSDSDTLLVFEPSYIGFTGACSITRTHVELIPSQGSTICFQSLQSKVESIIKNGKKPRALYINPDFSNPLGMCLTKSERLKLLQFCHHNGISIIEDNPYGQFYFGDSKPGTLKSLDKFNLVYYVGSFAKTVAPGLRIGYVVCPREQEQRYESLKAAKSMISVNTSQLMQAVVGGFLIKHDYSLNTPLAELRKAYKGARNIVLDVLQERFEKVSGVSWNSPDGGFFLVITLPFEFTQKEVEECASTQNVICMPVSFFTSDNNHYWNNSIRIAFSNISGEELRAATERLCVYILSKMSHQ